MKLSYWIVVLILISILILPVMASTQVNYTASKGGVFNGGFETGTGGQSNGAYGAIGSDNYGWFRDSTHADGNIRYDSNVSHSGLKSIYVNGTASTDVWFGTDPKVSAASPTTDKYLFSLKPSTTYKLSYWAYHAGGTDQAIGVLGYNSVNDIPTTQTQYNFPSTPVSFNTWNKYNHSFTTGSTINSGYIYMYQTVRGTYAYIDDITLEEVVTDTQATAQQVKPVIQGVTSVDNIDQSWGVNNSFNGFGSPGGTVTYQGQTFIANKTRFTGATFKKAPNMGSPTGNIIVKVTTTSAGAPTSTILASTTIPKATWDTIPNYTYTTVNLPCLLTYGTQYAVTFESSATEGSGSYYSIASDTTGGYTGGTIVYYQPSAWVVYTGDYDFKTLYAKNTEDTSITVNGVQMLLNTSVTRNATHMFTPTFTGNFTSDVSGAIVSVKQWGASAPAGNFMSEDYANGWAAFDHRTVVDYAAGQYWVGYNAVPSLPQWISLYTPQSHVATNYTLYACNRLSNADFYNMTPRSWQFQGSNDGATWTTLDTVTGKVWKNSETNAAIDNQSYPNGGWSGGINTVAYNYYRINVTQMGLWTSQAAPGIGFTEIYIEGYDPDNADGLLSGAIVDTDRGTFNWSWVPTASNLPYTISSVYHAEEMDTSVPEQYNVLTKGWYYSTGGYLGVEDNPVRPTNITWKINTMLNITSLDITYKYYGRAGNNLTASSDYVTWTALSPLSTTAGIQTTQVSTNNFNGNSTIYIRQDRLPTGSSLNPSQLWVNATLNTTGLPVQSVIVGTNYYNISSNGRADSASLDPSMRVNVWLMGQGSSVTIPIVQWLMDRTVVRVPGVVTVNDTSLNSPTSYFYNWTDGQPNSTFQNGTHVFGLRGGYNISHTAINSAGSNTSYKLVTVIGGMGPQGFLPGSTHPLLNLEDCTFSSSRELSAWEYARTECKICGLCEA